MTPDSSGVVIKGREPSAAAGISADLAAGLGGLAVFTDTQHCADIPFTDNTGALGYTHQLIDNVTNLVILIERAAHPKYIATGGDGCGPDRRLQAV